MAASADDCMVRVLDGMRAAHRDNGHWLTLNMVRAYSGNLEWPLVKQAVYGLAASGFLYMRDPDTKKELLLVQLREEYRK